MAHAETPNEGQRRASARKRQRQAEWAKCGGKPVGISREVRELMDSDSKAHRRVAGAFAASCPSGYRGL